MSASRAGNYGPRAGTLVLGLGNPLRQDDGVGPRVVEELARQGLPDGVTALDGGTAALDLLWMLQGWDRVVVVDAAAMGREPGRFVRFTPDDARLREAQGGFSPHSAGLAEALNLARVLEQPLPYVVVFGVQPERIGWGQGISPCVEAALPALLEAILREVGEDHAQDSDR